MYLFFDTETTGVPANYKAPYTNTDNWPRIVQIAFILASDDLQILAKDQFIIRPNGFDIPKGASDVHGISTEKAHEQGKELAIVVPGIYHMAIANKATIVCHNYDFDSRILAAEMVRVGNINVDRFMQLPKICTKLASVDLCKIQGAYGYKWPKLQELHQHIFAREFDNAHDAMGDIVATFDCFKELKTRKIV